MASLGHNELTHCSLVMLYDVKDLAQYRLRSIWSELLKISICKMSLKNTLIKLFLHLSGASELIAVMQHITSSHSGGITPNSMWSNDAMWRHHDDVIKWKHFPRYWPFVRGIHQSPVNSPHKGQWRGALMFSLICTSNKWLIKQPWGWWFETPLHSLWRHCNDRSE